MNDIKSYLQERLANGEDMSSILNGIADIANDILDAKKADQEKIAAADELMKASHAFFSKYYPDMVGDDTEPLTGAELVEVLDELAPTVKEMLDFAKPAKVQSKRSVKHVKKSANPDAIIADFLRDLGI